MRVKRRNEIEKKYAENEINTGERKLKGSAEKQRVTRNGDRVNKRKN